METTTVITILNRSFSITDKSRNEDELQAIATDVNARIQKNYDNCAGGNCDDFGSLALTAYELAYELSALKEKYEYLEKTKASLDALSASAPQKRSYNSAKSQTAATADPAGKETSSAVPVTTDSTKKD